MAKTAETKTNVMRILDQKRIPYTAHSYPHAEGQAVDGVTVASFLGMAPERVFKTLVTKGASGAYYVFDIPINTMLFHPFNLWIYRSCTNTTAYK